MAGFLSKFGAKPTSKARAKALHSTSSAVRKEKLQWRDEEDPRVLYRISDRARRISLKVNSSDREVVVVVPGERAIAKARQFAKQQRDWIDVQLETLPPPQPFVPGGEILLKGLPYELVHTPGRERPKINDINRRVLVSAPDEDAFKGRVKRLLIREAREELEAATHFYADKLGREVEKISVRDTSSRWGSCITRKGLGHISYSWRLISAPPFVLEYVAAHECAHMIEDNHSQAFWDVVDRISDDVKPAKAWLRKNGAQLHAVGADF